MDNKEDKKLSSIIEGKNPNMDKYGRFENQAKQLSGLKNPFDWRIKIKELLKNRKWESWVDDSIKLKNLDSEYKNHIIWLGHSSFYLVLDGIKILIDPVFSSVPFVKRIVDLPIDTLNFKEIDYVLISHDHYDHLDKKSIRTILAQSSSAKLMCGSGTEHILDKLAEKYSSGEVIPMHWYDKYRHLGLKITFLPSLHWSRRSIADSRTRLWGAFMIQYGDINIYFSGDTSYGEHFKEVRMLFGHIDYMIVGIGAFRPRPHVHRNHISPREAIWASRDMSAGVTIPMHYNTFDLSRERYIEPLHIFKKAAEINGVRISIPRIGEILELKSNKQSVE